MNAIYTVRHLSKKFPNSSGEGSEALVDINLEIYEGECLVITGANGSGKTLLVRILTGLMDASSGDALYRGTPVSKCLPLIRRSVGIVFQDADSQIVGETVEEDIRFGPENLKLPKDEIENRVRDVLKTLDLEGKKETPPRHLSGGEKRRLAAAGVLAMGCDTVIMDEPFANLDWPGVEQVLTIILNLRANKKTVVILTHELEKVLAFADRLLILAGGKVRDQGSPGEVLDRLDPAWGVRDPRRSYLKVEDCAWL
ncbi:ABC transporter ATP-binding protein [Spirochaetia bacterium]|nr:ABC transporter ATP-binding protein [Spirochaetia bacterium]